MYGMFTGERMRNNFSMKVYMFVLVIEISALNQLFPLCLPHFLY